MKQDMLDVVVTNSSFAIKGDQLIFLDHSLIETVISLRDVSDTSRSDMTVSISYKNHFASPMVS